MINKLNLLNCLIVAILLLVAKTGFSFPENIRYGYANCETCHISPTGGGLLSEYGRRSSEEFMFTWSKPEEADLFHGAVSLPESVNVGGDLRFLSLHRDNRVTESNVGFPMQAEVEGAYTPAKFTLAAAFGSYDNHPDVRRYFLMYQPSDNWYFRAGKFLPAFGIMNADHSISTRKYLKFDQGQETNNVEAGYLNENFEFIVDAIGGSGSEEMPQDKGFSARFASYIGKDKQIGLSYLQGRGDIWNRKAFGIFALLSLNRSVVFQTEIDQQKKKAIDSTDASLPDHKEWITYSKLSWEFVRGLHALASYESVVPDEPTFTQTMRAYGPGLQWFPRPHFEFVASVQAKLDEAYSKKYGNQALLMSHYYF